MDEHNRQPGRASVQLEGTTLRCSGRWTVRHLADLGPSLGQLARAAESPRAIDMAAVERMDTWGAWLLVRTVAELEAQGRSVTLTGLSGEGARLYELVRGWPPPVRSRRASAGPVPGDPGSGRSDCTARHPGFLVFPGRDRGAGGSAARASLAFALARDPQGPAQAGDKAMPILGLLSFLLGVVIAYQGAVQLSLYGATIFIADLVGFDAA